MSPILITLVFLNILTLSGPVAERVAENEALYRDIEVTYKSEYRRAGKDPGPLKTPDGAVEARAVQEEVRTVHIVLQKGMYRIATTTKTTVNKDTKTRTHIIAFDGTKTLVRDGEVASEADDPDRLPREVYFPHLWAIASNWWDSTPLSIRITGGKKWENHPNLGSFYKDYTLSSKVVDRSAMVAGEPCVVVREESMILRKLRGARVVWLTPSKNYLPIRNEKYSFSYSEKLPIETVECGDFRELRPGVWLPYRVTRTVFDGLELRDGKQVISNTTKITVTDAKLNPKFDRQFFQNTQPDK